MKIGDIEIGVEYGAVGSERYSDSLPRRVEVIEIVTVEEKSWSPLTEQPTTRNVRKVKVKFLDPAPREQSTYYGPSFASLKKGATTVLGAKEIAAPWSELREGIRKEVETKLAEKELKLSIEKRVKAIVGRSEWFHVSVRGTTYDLSLHGRAAEKLLAAAEKE